MRRGFTLIELLVVIAIIGLLSSVVLASLESARTKARDTRRLTDMDQIMKALNIYYDEHGCLPRPGSNACGIGDPDAGGWDYSTTDTFMPFLVTEGLFSSTPVDPLNNGTGTGPFAYRYYCYTPGQFTTGLHLGYWRESDNQYVNHSTIDGTWGSDEFRCQ